LGYDLKDIAQVIGGFEMPSLIKLMWEKWGPNELSLFLSEVEG
jgi:hypothetical protein